MSGLTPSLIIGVIVAHEKDFETLGDTLHSLRKQAKHRFDHIVVISAQNPGQEILSRGRGVNVDNDEISLWISEADFPFHITDFEECLPSPGWVYQQMLKFYIPFILREGGAIVPKDYPLDRTFFVVVDADTIWLKRVSFVEEGRANLSTYCIEDIPASMRSSRDLHRYDDFVEAMLPGLQKRRKMFETAVVHHTVLQGDILEDLMEKVLAASGLCFWQRVRELALGRSSQAEREVNNKKDGEEFSQELFKPPSRVPDHRLSVSEYELYFAFAWTYHRDRLNHRPLVFAVIKDWRTCLSDPPPEATYLVCHSHLRCDATLTKKDLAEREGIIGVKQSKPQLKASEQVALLMEGRGAFDFSSY